MDTISVTCVGCGVVGKTCGTCGDIPHFVRRGSTCKPVPDNGTVKCIDCAGLRGPNTMGIAQPGESMLCAICSARATACVECGSKPEGWRVRFGRWVCGLPCDLRAFGDGLRLHGVATVREPDERGFRTVESFDLTHSTINEHAAAFGEIPGAVRDVISMETPTPNESSVRCEGQTDLDRPFHKVGDRVRPMRGPFSGVECVVVEKCPRDSCWYEVAPAGGTCERALYDWRDLLVEMQIDHAAMEAALVKFRRREQRARHAAGSLERPLSADILNAVLFGGFPQPKQAQRVALGTETLNSIAELLGLRNGMVTVLDLPPKFARIVRKIDDALMKIEPLVFPGVEIGGAWRRRDAERVAAAKGMACHE